MKEHVYDRISEIKVPESTLVYSNLRDPGSLEENEKSNTALLHQNSSRML